MAQALMFQGTGSDVGKTVLVAGLCRVMMRRGLRVAPFKPQNMSNNAAVTDDGGEIGRAQWLQARACALAPSVDMNPVLLKPQSETGSQIVVHGKVIGTARGRDYQALKPSFMASVMESYVRLSTSHDIVLVEGAGSPAEINLRGGDIANMGFATRAGVPVVLVGDIDRGGVIASLAGTHAILPAEDRVMIAGYLINKFRGDVSLFDDGLRAIEQHTGWPCFGVVPWLKSVARLPAEDSVALERMSASSASGAHIVVPVTGRIANFDDLDPLCQADGVRVTFLRDGMPFPHDCDAIILAGSKSTIADLADLRRNGWDRAIVDKATAGIPVVGICGGYQMLGGRIEDPDGLEGGVSAVDGLGLLAVDTVMQPRKVTRNVHAHSVVHDCALTGYEIHLGRTSGPDTARPFALIDGRPDGAVSENGLVMGTYLHGLFDGGAFRARWLFDLGVDGHQADHGAHIENALDELADDLSQCLDIDALIEVAMRAETRSDLHVV